MIDYVWNWLDFYLAYSISITDNMAQTQINKWLLDEEFAQQSFIPEKSNYLLYVFNNVSITVIKLYRVIRVEIDICPSASTVLWLQVSCAKLPNMYDLYIISKTGSSNEYYGFGSFPYNAHHNNTKCVISSVITGISLLYRSRVISERSIYSMWLIIVEASN